MSLDQMHGLEAASSAVQPDRAGNGALAAQPRASAIFLHAGWRSCGTWLWEALRENPSTRAYYEPLHEGLARLDQAAIGQFRPDSWGSGHGTGAPYFAEFASLLKRTGHGVAQYDQHFAFNDFFTPAQAANPALQAYLARLLHAAEQEGRLPVLKFCRSLGRVAWMQQHFPDAMHAVILRDPLAQWRSARLQMERDANHYFVLAPYLILARNAAHPLLADIAGRLGVLPPPHLSDDPGITLTATWRHVQLLSWAERYRGFLALWAATAVTALASNATLLDADLLRTDPAHRREAEHAISTATGWNVSLPVSAAPAANQFWLGSQAEAEDAARAALIALDFAATHAAALGADRAGRLAEKLTPRLTLARGIVVAPRTAADLPAAPPPATRGPRLRTLDAAAYVALARASYPLRRAHYYMDRWLKR